MHQLRSYESHKLYIRFRRKTTQTDQLAVMYQKCERLKMDITSTLIWGVIFGSIGLGFFVYGKKQKAVIPICCGIGLMVFPYFISNVYFLVLSGAILVALPFFIKR